MRDPFMEVVTESDLQRRVGELGAALNDDYAGREPVLLGVLKGSVPFLADLVRHIDVPMDIDFLALTRFGAEGRVSVALDAAIDLQGRHVVIVEDIVDTGLTLTALRRFLEMREVASVATVALLDKAPRRIVDVPVEHRGFQVGDEYLLGYGLDWKGRYRNLRSLWAALDLSVLKENPDALSPRCYPGLSL